MTEIQETRRYDFATIESKWQSAWRESELFEAPEHPDVGRGKFYMLVMFAYPSGDIHMGHFRNYIIGDAVARRQMMLGKDVLHPFGWDAFGLPAERAAIQRKLNPAEWTTENIEISRDTLQKVGISYDWSREVVTCQPDYYRWSQWIFLKLFEHGLAYRKKGLVNWCPDCLTVLANEQVVNGLCERCDSPVEKKELEQWYFKITRYADQLLDALDDLPGWPENLKTMQREWIGRSYGAEVEFTVENSDLKIPVYTTRLDTIYGVTFMALAPESELIEKLEIPDQKRTEVETYRKQALLKREIERGGEADEKTGVDTGLRAINPYNGKKIPIWVADYVLAHYGAGAVMGVPANDTRDLAFTEKFNLPVIQILKRADGAESKYGEVIPIAESMTINSGEFSDLDSAEAIELMAERAQSEGFGKKAKQFRLRDWLISRQRYWGTPIPIIHCQSCGLVPVEESNLPVLLPRVTDYTPKGRSPLADVPEFMNINCPKCGGDAQRDPDTMDTFICSSWYHLRYVDPKNTRAAFDSKKANDWLPIDKYIGGITHATGHLLYFRFLTRFLRDIGMLSEPEPAREMFNHGMVMDSDGVVMSKSKGNVVSPSELM
ncbi:MAG: leucine--tRNA ligase, partial [Candidatus Zixiibacteriota bacterium]